MRLDFSTQKWNTVGLINLPPAIINILPPLSISVSPVCLCLSPPISLCVLLFVLLSFSLFCFFTLSSFVSVYHHFPLCLSVLCSVCLCVSNSGRRWPNSSLKQRHSIYMQIRRRYVYALLKQPVELRNLWVVPCFMHEDTATGNPMWSILNSEVNWE